MMSGPYAETLHELPESVRSAVATLASRPLGMTLVEWNLVSGTLLNAADEIERLRNIVELQTNHHRALMAALSNPAQ